LIRLQTCVEEKYSTRSSDVAISKLPQSVFRSIGINTTKYRPLVFGSIDPNTTVVFRSIDHNTTVVFRSIHPNTSVVFRSIGPILNVVLRSNNVVSDVALRSIDVVFRSIDS
jgi:hypothetical protein